MCGSDVSLCVQEMVSGDRRMERMQSDLEELLKVLISTVGYSIIDYLTSTYRM